MKQSFELPSEEEVLDLINKLKCNDQLKDKIIRLFDEIKEISNKPQPDEKTMKRKSGKLLILLAKATGVKLHG